MTILQSSIASNVIQGSTGPIGSTGATGPLGSTGATGVQGIKEQQQQIEELRRLINGN